jgi:hypothetical protein
MAVMSAHETLEHTEHIAHAGHHDEHGHEHGHGHGHAGKAPLGTHVGITMAVLGVLLAFCAARVGAERTELVETLVAQQNAHAKYQAQDVKHRVAVLALQQAHAGIVAGTALDKKDIAGIAHTVERYLEESKAAKEWVEAYEPAIEAHLEGQEHYELAQLLAEIGIVIASVALLLKRREAWFASLALGAGAVIVTASTWHTVSGQMHGAEAKIEETGKEYRRLRDSDKTTDAEHDLVQAVNAWAGVSEEPHEPAVPHEAAHEEEHH